MSGFARQRRQMVDRHIAARGVRDAGVLEAMRAVPRERFVEPGMEEFAYEDSPLPIGSRQTISQPYIVALMAEAAELGEGDKVLEVGTGSGYAAAVFAEVAGEVYTIERHAALADGARERLDALGYRNVHVRAGDGTRGWPDEAPFDAIIVAAGAPEPPPALRGQLAIGGRLVIPVGEQDTLQRLRKIVRMDAQRYEEQDLGGVMFVPLVGEQGWSADARAARTDAAPPRSLPRRIADAAIALPSPREDAFADAFDRYGDCRVVLLGECTHGTREFYQARAAISRRLLERHGFDFVAVEADWPDAAAIDRHIRGRPEPAGAEPPFQRFPTWMWRNAEFMAFVRWMREHNDARDGRRIGFHGLDLYNLRGAIDAVLRYLDDTDPEAASVARERYGCLTPWQKDPATYGRAVVTRGYRACEDQVVRQCEELLRRHLEQPSLDGDGLLDAAHSARLVASAERYYRTMYYGGAESWNLRDTHMFETLELLLDAHGPESRGIVWAHNSHIGDARQTEMGAARGEHNIGQLVREKFGFQAALVGFGTDRGTVAAAHDWDGELEIMDVAPSREGSVERLCRDSAVPSFLLDLRDGLDIELKDALREERLERFIGVIYRPRTELQSHYVGARVADQFDGYAWFDQTHAVTPIGAQEPVPGRVPDTYPSGL